MKRTRSILASIVAVVILFGGLVAHAEPAAKPNVLFILADDIGWGDLGCYGGKIPTPNLDRLAAEGMRFTDAHAPAALCAPTRFSLMTGSNPYRNGRPWGTWSLKASSAFEANRHHDTVGDVMQRAGYTTAFIGKQNFGGEPRDVHGTVTHDYAKIDFSKSIGDGMRAHGFHYSLGMSSGIQNPPYVFFENDRFKPIDPDKPASNQSTTVWTAGSFPNPDGTTNIIPKDDNYKVGDVDWNSAAVGPMLANAAVDFIDQHLERNAGAPFLLYYASQAIHTPHTPANALGDTPIRGTTLNAKTDMIKELDAQVGMILDKLDDARIADQTLVFFTSDNGGLRPINAAERAAGHDSVNGLRDYKGSAYEGGHRVPFIVRWGDGSADGSYIKPGSVSAQGITAADWVATLYDLTGQNMPDHQAMDATTLLPVLLGYRDETQPLHDYFIVQSAQATWTASHHVVYHPDHKGKWVLLLDKKRKPLELYDLATDLAQTTNLINDPTQADRIQHIRAWFLSHDSADEDRTTPAFKAVSQTVIPRLRRDGNR